MAKTRKQVSRPNKKTDRDLLRLYQKAPFAQPGQPRIVGMEDEFPVVDAKGNMGSSEQVICALHKLHPEWERHREGVVISATHPQFGAITIEAGDATLEWSSPAGDLFSLAAWRRQVLNHLVAAAALDGQYLLGTGRHPLTRATKKRLTPKKRYWLFWRRYRENFLSLLEGTAQQIQIHCYNPEDQINLTNHFLQLSGLIIALTANSPIYWNKAGPLVSSRVPMWDQYAPGRVGIPERPFIDMIDWCRQMWSARLIFGPTRRHKGLMWQYDQPFGQIIREHPMGQRELREFALIHEGCLWWDVRPRFKFGSFEFRSACQQPQWMEIALAALILGMVENTIGRQSLINLFPWEIWRRTRWSAAEFHFLAPIGEKIILKELLAELVDMAEIGLKIRGLGEEVFLEPIKQLMQRGHPPAIDQLQAFKQGGVEEVVKRFAYRLSP